jgi:tRNA nucleotidyltransferase (CCA-adding enzyme)
MERLTALQMADFGGDGSDEGLGNWLALLRSIAQSEGALTLKTLAVMGKDLLELGFAPGPELGRALEGLLERVIAGELPNERAALMEEGKKLIS